MAVIKVNKNMLDKIHADFADYIVDKEGDYILFSAEKDGTVITAYSNKKNVQFKIVISGKNTQEFIEKYADSVSLLSDDTPKEKKYKESKFYVDTDAQIGSDEVGVGDFLGPLVVCAAYCDKETMKIVEQYGIKDSKKFTDQDILEIVPDLLGKVYYEVKVFPNERYNKAITKDMNFGRIKCILHNYCLVRLNHRCPKPKHVFMDKFCSESSYYNNLRDEKIVIRNIIFKEKGETYWPSVALGSCIARYFFLKHMEELNKKYNMTIPFGAGKTVDEFTQKFIQVYGIEELKKVCKMNFANYRKLDI